MEHHPCNFSERIIKYLGYLLYNYGYGFLSYNTFKRRWIYAWSISVIEFHNKDTQRYIQYDHFPNWAIGVLMDIWDNEPSDWASEYLCRIGKVYNPTWLQGKCAGLLEGLEPVKQIKSKEGKYV